MLLTFKAIDRSFVRYFCLRLVLFVTLCTRLQKHSVSIAMSRDQTCAFQCLRDAGKAKDTSFFLWVWCTDGLFVVVWCTYVAQEAEKALNSFRAMSYLFREMPSASSAKRKRSRNENKTTQKKKRNEFES